MAKPEQIQALASGPSIEVTPPAAARVESFRASLPARTRVKVTMLPGTDTLDTMAAAARWRAEGMAPVPHSPARSIPICPALGSDRKHLRAEAEMDQALVIGGGVAKPVGRFESASASVPHR